MASTELIDKTKEVLADTFVMYMKAHGYHWNVIGPDFPQLHGFFGDLYGELWAATDGIAEQIRALDSFAQGTLGRMVDLSNIDEDEKIPQPAKMVSNLSKTNEQVMNTITECYEMAEKEKSFALSNFLQDRLTVHAKHGWMLRSITK